MIAFHPQDNPSDADIAAVLADFRSLAFAGLPDDGFAWTAVQHGATGSAGEGHGVHVHVLIARVELHTGLAFNPAPPVWRKHFDHVRDAWNAERGWARPEDRERARLVRPAPHDMYRAAAARRAGQAPASDVRTAVTDWLVGQIELGRVTDRDTLLPHCPSSSR